MNLHVGVGKKINNDRTVYLITCHMDYFRQPIELRAQDPVQAGRLILGMKDQWNYSRIHIYARAEDGIEPVRADEIRQMLSDAKDILVSYALNSF